MSPLEQLALAGQGLRRTLREMGTPGLWGPWAALGALELAALAALVTFAHPLVAGAMAPLVRAVGGEPALHYPGLYRALPLLYGRADLVLGALAGAVAAGWSTALFAARWHRRAPEPGVEWGRTAPRAVTLVLAQAPFPVLALALSEWLGRALARPGATGPGLAYLGSLAGTVLLQAVFLFVPALVVLERRGPFRAWAALPRAWARGFWAALALGVAGLLPLLPLDRLQWSSGVLVERGIPELVAWLVGVQLLIGLAVSFLLAGSATLVYLGAVADEAGERA